MTILAVRDHLKGAWVASVVCCVGVVVTGLFVQNSVFSLSIAAALCVALLPCTASARGSRTHAMTLLFFNSGLVAMIFVVLRVTLNLAWRGGLWSRSELWSWLYRFSRVSWLSECSAIILALIGLGCVAIELAGKIGGDAARKRFRWNIIAAASVLVAVNIANFLRPVWCYDCFFPYGLPFTLYTEGGYAGGAGFEWTGLVADAALIPAFAAIGTLLWNQLAR